MKYEFRYICSEFQQHPELFGMRDGTRMEVNIICYLGGIPSLLARDAEFCEMLIRAEDIDTAMASCPTVSVISWLMYITIAKRMGETSTASLGAMVLPGKDSNKGEQIDKFGVITPLNANCKILAKV